MTVRRGGNTVSLTDFQTVHRSIPAWEGLGPTCRRCWWLQGRAGPKLTHRPVVGDGVHAEGQLLAWVLQQLAPLGEGLGDHLALLDAFGLIIALSGQPESSRGWGGKVEGRPLSTESCERPANPSPLGPKPPEGLKSLKDSEEYRPTLQKSGPRMQGSCVQFSNHSTLKRCWQWASAPKNRRCHQGAVVSHRAVGFRQLRTDP